MMDPSGQQLPRTLALDIGNSGMRAACFDPSGRIVAPVHRLGTGEWTAVDELATNHSADILIYSSVADVPPPDWAARWRTAGRELLTIERDRPLPFASNYRSLATLGQDRIAAVAGALARAEVGKPYLLVDAGTCITYDVIDGSGTHRGGPISPGIRLRLRAMHEGTRRLPLVAAENDAPPVLLPLTTEAALRSGGLLGATTEIEGMLARLEGDFPGIQLLLTGGDAALLLPQLGVGVLAYPHLVLEGLHQIMSFYVHERV